MLFGGLAQFIAGLMGYAARDCLVTVINSMWGTFWLAIGIVYLLVVGSFRVLFDPCKQRLTCVAVSLAGHRSTASARYP